MQSFISAKRIYNGFLMGANNISNYRASLNMANKFPVADSDTGDNLAYLMSKISENLHYNADIATMLLHISDLAVLNSRGNSGAIFSQFFVGFEQNSPNAEKIDLEQLIKCFESAYQSAYKAIISPILEGTILIAMKNWSDSLYKYKNKVSSLEKLYLSCLAELKSEVEATKNVLKQQRQAKACDAGAMAFLYFIDGFMSAVVYGKESDVIQLEQNSDFTADNQHDHLPFTADSNRFCTEFLLAKNTTPFDKKEFEKLGDSLVVSQTKNYIRIHIHSNQPAVVGKLAQNYGKIIDAKCDDMKVQSINAKQGETAIVIDSIADLPEASYSEHTYMLPVNILVDNVSFKDKRNIFPELLKSGNVSSAQPNSSEAKKLLEKLLIGYQNIIIITVSSAMSGIYNQYQKIIEELDSSRIRVVDSKLNSVGEGIVVYKALELIKANYPSNELIQRLERTIANSYIYVSLKSLDRMIASGRLNSKLGGILKFLNCHPTITIDRKGKGKIGHFSFSYKRSQTALIKTLLKQKEQLENYALVHCNNRAEAEAIARILTAKLGFPPLYISEISSVVANFSGDGSIAVGFSLRSEQ